MKKLFLILIVLFVSAISINAQTTPSNADAKRAWGIAQMYIEEESPELAITELKKVVYHENFAPAYLKLVELCYKFGDVKHMDMAEEYSKSFISLWPDRADEIKDIIALGEARSKLRKKKFYESLVGDWRHPNFQMGEWYVCFKIRKNENGNVYAIVPKQMYDYDWVTEWQDGTFMQWEGDNGVYIYEAQYAPYDGYRVKTPTSDGDTHWVYVYLYIPFDQPALSEGKIKATFSTKTSAGNNKSWKSEPREIELLKD
ncbi:MAG: hypothetical protein K2L46_03540 [Paramuribaculum sp.]|nr:hypothetical protein [Paramuribaculum sp.]MDE6323367.1 hypothetical protein [Paramuribaculum sp.]MDE6488331.1 hypothetical protein [Paramuribaculum sp.]